MSSYQASKLWHGFFVGLRYAVLIVTAFLSLCPFFWVLLSAFKSSTEIYINSFGLPREWNFANIMNVLNSPNMRTGYFNSIVTTGCVLAITIFFGSMTAYVTSRVLKGSLMYNFFALGIMIPMTSILIPTFIILKDLHLVYTRPGVILAYTASTMPITVFLLHGFMKNLPKELEEAATIDGCSRAGGFFRIILPLSKPGIATVLTLNMLTVWNDYLFALVIGGKASLRNLTVTIYYFRTEFIVDYGMTCAGLIFSILPLALVYVIFQEQVIKGMAEGAIKA